MKTERPAAASKLALNKIFEFNTLEYSQERKTKPFPEMFPKFVDFMKTARELLIDDIKIEQVIDLSNQFVKTLDLNERYFPKLDLKCVLLNILNLFKLLHENCNNVFLNKPTAHKYYRSICSIIRYYLDIEIKLSKGGGESAIEVVDRICLILNNHLPNEYVSLYKLEVISKLEAISSYGLYKDVLCVLFEKTCKLQCRKTPLELGALTFLKHLLVYKTWHKALNTNIYSNIQKKRDMLTSLQSFMKLRKDDVIIVRTKLNAKDNSVKSYFSANISKIKDAILEIEYLKFKYLNICDEITDKAHIELSIKQDRTSSPVSEMDQEPSVFVDLTEEDEKISIENLDSLEARFDYIKKALEKGLAINSCPCYSVEILDNGDIIEISSDNDILEKETPPSSDVIMSTPILEVDLSSPAAQNEEITDRSEEVIEEQATTAVPQIILEDETSGSRLIDSPNSSSRPFKIKTEVTLPSNEKVLFRAFNTKSHILNERREGEAEDDLFKNEDIETTLKSNDQSVIEETISTNSRDKDQTMAKLPDDDPQILEEIPDAPVVLEDTQIETSQHSNEGTSKEEITQQHKNLADKSENELEILDDFGLTEADIACQDIDVICSNEDSKNSKPIEIIDDIVTIDLSSKQPSEAIMKSPPCTIKVLSAIDLCKDTRTIPTERALSRSRILLEDDDMSPHSSDGGRATADVSHKKRILTEFNQETSEFAEGQTILPFKKRRKMSLYSEPSQKDDTDADVEDSETTQPQPEPNVALNPDPNPIVINAPPINSTNIVSSPFFMGTHNMDNNTSYPATPMISIATIAHLIPPQMQHESTPRLSNNILLNNQINYQNSCNQSNITTNLVNNFNNSSNIISNDNIVHYETTPIPNIFSYPQNPLPSSSTLMTPSDYLQYQQQHHLQTQQARQVIQQQAQQVIQQQQQVLQQQQAQQQAEQVIHQQVIQQQQAIQQQQQYLHQQEQQKIRQQSQPISLPFGRQYLGFDPSKYSLTSENINNYLENMRLKQQQQQHAITTQNSMSSTSRGFSDSWRNMVPYFKKVQPSQTLSDSEESDEGTVEVVPKVARRLSGTRGDSNSNKKGSKSKHSKQK